MSLLREEEQRTLEVYNEIADGFAESHDDPKLFEKEIAHFQKLLPKGRVLEVGCGGGRDAKALIEFGYDYVGADISASFIDIAKRNNPDAEFYEASVYDLSSKWENEFDGFWASAVLLHVPRDRMGEALKSVGGTQRKGAVGYISLKEGDGEADDAKYGAHFIYWQKADFAEALADNGFKIIDYMRDPMSEKTRWLCYYVEKL